MLSMSAVALSRNALVESLHDIQNELIVAEHCYEMYKGIDTPENNKLRNYWRNRRTSLLSRKLRTEHAIREIKNHLIYQGFNDVFIQEGNDDATGLYTYWSCSLDDPR